MNVYLDYNSITYPYRNQLDAIVPKIKFSKKIIEKYIVCFVFVFVFYFFFSSNIAHLIRDLQWPGATFFTAPREPPATTCSIVRGVFITQSKI